MLPVWKIGAIGAGGFIFVVVAAVVAWTLLKIHHNRWMESSRDEENRLHEEHRFRGGSLGGSAEPYAPVTQAQAPSRRSIHLPYGLMPQGWMAISSRESLSNPAPMASVPQSAAPRSKLKRDRSVRHSLTLPRSVRPKKSDKAIALVYLQKRSPLSAITERSQTNSVASPDLNVVSELPTHITPKATPEKDERADIQDENRGQVTMGRPTSTAWPLPRSQRLSNIERPGRFITTQSELLVPEVEESPAPNARPLIGQRNASITSQMSGTAPKEPVPPVPSDVPKTRCPQRRTSKLRISTASIETAGSSILGDTTTGSQADTDFTSISLASPPYNSYEGGRNRDPGSEIWDASSFTRLGSPPGRQTMRSLRMKQMSHGSFQGVIGQDSLQRMASTSQLNDLRSEKGSMNTRQSGSSLLQVPSEDQQWPPSRYGSLKSSAHLSIPGQSALGRHSSVGARYRPQDQRHSMFESFGSQSHDPGVLRNVSGNNLVPVRAPPKRPASVSGTSPFQWDHSTLQSALPSAMRDASGSRKGHKRQNCVRISNLPPITIGSAPLNFPPTVEESDESSHSPQKPKIPGLTLLESESRSKVPSIPTFEPQISTFTGHDRSRLNSLYQAPLISRITDPRGSSSQPQSDDDVFRSRLDPRLSSFFQLSDSTQWRFAGNRISQSGNTLSPPPNPRKRSSPEAPPSPAQFHFSRPLHLQTSPAPIASPSPNLRSGHGTPVLGPRSPHSSRPNSHASFRLKKSKPRSQVPASGSGRELHRSVMLLRRMNSDANSPKTLETRASHIYLDLGASPARPSSPAISPGMSNLKSPSLLSVGGGSIWEDASIGGSPISPMVNESFAAKDINGKKPSENFRRGTEIWNEQGRILQSKNPFATPQGKGLGLVAWGTPGSLYDRDGFLKE